MKNLILPVHQNRFSLDDVVSILGVKRRTVIFWIEEFDLGDMFQHSNAGNSYGPEVIKLLYLIGRMKDTGWYTGRFIRRAIDELKVRGAFCLPELSFEKLALCDIAASLVPDKPVTCEEEVGADVAESSEITGLQEQEYDEMFSSAESARQSGNNSLARELYMKLAGENSPYGEIARIAADLLPCGS